MCYNINYVTNLKQKEVKVYFIKLGEVLHKRDCESPKNNQYWFLYNSNGCCDKI